jgi:hypothetical protein
MTRVTLSELKSASRDRTKRRTPPAPGAPPIVTPMPTAQSAIRRHHVQGAERAIAVLNETFDRSSYWGPRSTHAPAKGWANAIRDSFQIYVDLAGTDSRPSMTIQVKRDVELGEHSVGVAPDVVLIDDDGYVGRLVLWDKEETSQDEAEFLAAPIVRALEDELGAGRTLGVEVWHLRSRQQFYVTAEEALERLREVQAVLHRYIS